MSKKYIVTWILNVMAFGSLMATVYSECGGIIFVKVLIPAAIMFGSLWGLFFVLLKNKDSN